jgi:hypothetical protein
MAYDTPYNARLLAVLEKYDRERDTNGQPDIFEDRMMEGGAFLGVDGRVHTAPSMHPHLNNHLLGSMSREMGSSGGRFNLGKSMRQVGHALAPAGREIGHAGLSVAKDVGRYGLQLAQKEATRRGRQYLDSYMSGEGVYSGGLMRPPGMVSPFVALKTGLVVPGTMGTYPMYNAVEMRGINGGACCGQCAGGKFDFGKALGSVAKGVGKVALPIATKVGTKVAEDALMAAMMGAGVPSGGKFNFGKALGSVAKGVGKVALPIATKVGTKVAEDALTAALMGAGAKKPRGRPRKMVSGANSSMGASGSGVGSGGKFSIGKALGSVAKGVGKVAVPIATKVGTKMAEKALTDYMSGEGVGSGGKFNFGKALGSVAKGVGKVALPIATKVGTKVAEDALTAALMGAGVDGVGVMKRPRGRPRKMDGGKFDFFKTITDIGKKAGEPFEKSVGVNPFTMGYDLGHDVIAPALMGKGVRSGGGDGRKKRAEIVKKVMAEKGMKMIEASKYVKQHGLY